VKLWLVALSSLFLVVVIGQVMRMRAYPADWDGPSRYLMSGLLLLFFIEKRVRFAQMFAIVAPIALILALLVSLNNPEVAAKWSGRFATSFVDPNTLGSYAVILSFMTLIALDEGTSNPMWMKVVGYAGVAAGVFVATLAASRGGWLAAAPLFGFWIYCRWRLGARRIVAGFAIVLVFVVAALVLVPNVTSRAAGSLAEIVNWFNGSNTETAAGQRLSVWKLGLALFLEHPLTGYGPGIAEHLATAKFSAFASPAIITILVYGGPHSDLLGMVLGSGILGILPFILLLLMPIGFFWKHLRSADPDARLGSELGVALALGVLVCGLTNEMLSLKYLASFYGITMAGLAAQVLSSAPPRNP
jgi:O-antigen ligase